MPVLTNRSRLNPGPPPDAPPWRWLDSRTLEHWLRISGQTAANWRKRGNGPAWRKDLAGRCWYRVADVKVWLNGGDAMELIRAYLSDHIEAIREHIIDTMGVRLRGRQLHHALGLAHKEVDQLTDEEIECFVEVIDIAQVFDKVNRMPRPFIIDDRFIGYK